MGKFVLVLVSILVCQITYAFALSKCNDTSGSNYAKDSAFEKNLNLLLANLTSKSSTLKFYNFTVGDASDQVYGLYQCRDDIGIGNCNKCVKTAIPEMINDCPLYKEAIKWYLTSFHCMVRYANRNIFSLPETDPWVSYSNQANLVAYSEFAPIFNTTMTKMIQNASSATPLFASAKTNWTLVNEFYSFAQCTSDLDNKGCHSCLEAALLKMVDCCSTQNGSVILMPSCLLKVEMYPFLNDTSSPTPPTPPTPHFVRNSEDPGGNKPALKPAMIAAIAAGVSVGLIILAVVSWICVCRKKPNDVSSDAPPASPAPAPLASPTTLHDGSESLGNTEFVQYSFATLKAATRDFSDENKLGKGGFGFVYKGTFENGKQLAIKRLSSTSGQGTKEFMVEASFLAKLQHNNLVKLVGFCSEGGEKLLVYEFMPNSSLERFLFDPIKRARLDWVTRSKILMGIAKGLQYLHEDSRLTIVHRDLKPENILLDKEMNPKIGDFGLARLIEVAQNSGTTSRIIGTQGYMAPECLIGEYSNKSDVYSFGVMLLEIVSGKNNRIFYQLTKQEDLPNYAWRLWNEGRSFDLTDPNLYNNCPSDEVRRCIHIGLLCLQANSEQRPKISSVVFMLTGLGDLLLPSVPGTSFPQLNVLTTYHGGLQSDTDQYSTKSLVLESSAHDLYPKPR